MKKVLGIIDHINALEPEFEKMTDEESKIYKEFPQKDK